MKILIITLMVFMTGCSAFDMAEYEKETGNLDARMNVDEEKLKEDGKFTDSQVKTLKESISLEIEEGQYDRYYTRMKGEPAGEDMQFDVPGMSVTLTDVFNPGEKAHILYYIGGGLIVLGVAGGYFLGWGMTIIVSIFGVGLISVGRFMSETWLVALIPGAAILIGAGYVVYRLYKGKREHTVLKDIAAAFDEFDDEEEVKSFLDDKRKHRDISIIESLKHEIK